MSLKKYLILMGLASLICWSSWATVIYFIDPEISGTLGTICFYTSLFFSLLGTFSLLGLCLRLVFKRKELPYKHIGISLRQALWFSLLINISLIMLAGKLFNWWSVSLLIMCFVIMEGLFLINSFSSRMIKKPRLHDLKVNTTDLP